MHCLPHTHSIGKDIRKLVDRPEDPHVFRLHKDRVYYVSERLMRLSTNIGKDALLSLGTCLGKFTKSRKFHLKITALPILAQYAKYKVWLKPAAEMTYLYGNHVPKVGIARMTEAIPQYAGVLVLNLTDIPLGFGVAAHSTETATAVDATAAVVLHQADVGEYLREEDTGF